MLEYAVPSRQFLRVLVLAGGPSAERQVSLESGLAVASALQSRGHRVTMFDPIDGTLRGVDPTRFDAAFIALHGTFGEDGTVQSLLEELQLPYTGSGVEASRTAMSKSATKLKLHNAGIPTPVWKMIFRSTTPGEIESLVSGFSFPLVIKPDCEGSSLGVSIVKRPEEVPAALESCFQYGSTGLIETAVLGTEWTVGVFDRKPLPPLQIVAEGEFYDFEAKYRSDRTEYHFASGLAPDLLMHMQDLAVKACRVLETRGIARVDFRLDRAEQPWILEINTIPGMTSHSLIPKAAARIGITFDDLCERALHSALAASLVSARFVA